MNLHVGFPLEIDRRGRVGAVGEERYVAQLIEQVLFTDPGERVNRPTFGSGLSQLLFGPTDQATTAAAQLAARQSIEKWLGDLIVLRSLQVVPDDAALVITVTYTLIETGVEQTVTFRRGTFAAGGE